MFPPQRFRIERAHGDAVKGRRFQPARAQLDAAGTERQLGDRFGAEDAIGKREQTDSADDGAGTRDGKADRRYV